MHGRSRRPTDHRIRTMPGRSMSSFHGRVVGEREGGRNGEGSGGGIGPSAMQEFVHMVGRPNEKNVIDTK